MLYINGRFLTQPVSGVQRYALELLGAFDELLDDAPQLRARLGPVQILVPHAVEHPGWGRLPLRVVPGGAGHFWEQGALFRASRDGVLLSLGNAGPLRHARHVLCLHDANLYEIPAAFSRRYRALHRVLRPRLARRAAALMTVSGFSAQSLARHLRVDEADFRVVPNSAEHMLRLPRGADVPQRYGLRPGGYLLSVGNQSANKNVARLIAAHGRSCAPDLVVVGGAVPGVAPVSAGRQARVRMLGRVPDGDLRGLYEGAAGFVFASLYEGFGIPPLEAMQLGVPVLCARSGAMPEVLGDAPLWFDPRSEAAMTQALNLFSGLGAQERRAMSVAGLARARRYRWQSSAEQLAGVIGGCLRSGAVLPQTQENVTPAAVIRAAVSRPVA
ncbi:MAG: glycosyltransferase family 4 protein [Sulfitobacter sp.]